MPAVSHHLQRRYDVSPDGADFGHMAIILGCLGVVLIFICILAFFVRLRPKRSGSLSTLVEVQRGNQSMDRRGPASTVIPGTLEVVGEVQESEEPPKYQASEQTIQQHDLPPVYESIEVWSRGSPQASRSKTNWTSRWPFRSTKSG